jgi:ornithine cyclodeaminase/alanine dehydrogenase-like protein (mu-crystallin family)
MTPVLVLSEEEVVELLDMEGCIECMEQALASLARGEVHFPLRPLMRAPGESHFLGMMPAFRGGEWPLYSLKTVVVVPDNPSRGLDAHQGTVTLFDGVTGQTLALMNASPVTAIRTAAVTAVATRRLARPDAKELAIVGAGVQARAHLEALPGFERVRIASRTPEHAEALAAESGAEFCSTAEEAVRGADVVVAATNSAEPVVRREWLKEGAHVNSVGMGQELDQATLRDGLLVVDRRESAEIEGKIDPAWIAAELGELVTGSNAGRTSPDELTVFRSLGIAVEDLFAAEYVVRRAQETGTGTTVEF